MKKSLILLFALVAVIACDPAEPDETSLERLQNHRTEMNTDCGMESVPCATVTVSDYNPEGTQWVDLKLPSGKLWADRNIGANRPTEYGWHLALGETQPKSNYCPETYWDYAGYSYTVRSWLTIPIYKMKKYNGDPLNTSDDPCRKYFGGSAHVPTAEEFEELITNTDHEIKVVGPVYFLGQLIIPEAECLVCTSKDGSAQIVLPCAGHCVGKTYYPAAVNPDFVWWGPEAEYWTNSTWTPYRYCNLRPDQSYAMVFTRHDYEVFGENTLTCPFPMNKYEGLSVRAIKNK